jgi:hypothetical protein
MPSCAFCRKQQLTGSETLFHSFPVGKGREEFSQIWKKFLGKPPSWDPKRSLLCSDHFEEGDYEVTPSGLKLKFFAVPTFQSNCNDSNGDYLLI